MLSFVSIARGLVIYILKCAVTMMIHTVYFYSVITITSIQGSISLPTPGASNEYARLLSKHTGLSGPSHSAVLTAFSALVSFPDPLFSERSSLGTRLDFRMAIARLEWG